VLTAADPAVRRRSVVQLDESKAALAALQKSWEEKTKLAEELAALASVQREWEDKLCATEAAEAGRAELVREATRLGLAQLFDVLGGGAETKSWAVPTLVNLTPGGTDEEADEPLLYFIRPGVTLLGSRPAALSGIVYEADGTIAPPADAYITLGRRDDECRLAARQLRLTNSSGRVLVEVTGPRSSDQGARIDCSVNGEPRACTSGTRLLEHNDLLAVGRFAFRFCHPVALEARRQKHREEEKQRQASPPGRLDRRWSNKLPPPAQEWRGEQRAGGRRLSTWQAQLVAKHTGSPPKPPGAVCLRGVSSYASTAPQLWPDREEAAADARAEVVQAAAGATSPSKSPPARPPAVSPPISPSHPGERISQFGVPSFLGGTAVGW
jgi:hypothetical protein